MKEYSYVVDRYAYETPTQIEEAKKELEAIEYIKENTDITDVKNAYSLYKKFNEKPTFFTEVGISFMEELFQVIACSGLIERRNVPPIKISKKNLFNKEPMIGEQTSSYREVKVEKQLEKISGRYRNLKIVTVFLAAIIVAMLYIARNADYSFISDYETQLIDKYVQWEEELKEREQGIKEKEQSLNIQVD